MPYQKHPTISCNCFDIEVMQFSGGERQVRVKNTDNWEIGGIRVNAILNKPEYVMDLLLITDAIRREVNHNVHFSLDLNYLPYARQDRVCSQGESLSLKVFCNLINSLKYNEVIVSDCHSDVGLALLDNVVHRTQLVCFNSTRYEYNTSGKFLDMDEWIVVAPDAGSMKKAAEIAKHYKIPMVRADKTRDVMTGQITGTVVYSEHVGSKNFIVVDDICDGGRTFIELAKKLRPLTNGKLYLYVTHGIFSQGKQLLLYHYGEILCYNDMSEIKH